MTSSIWTWVIAVVIIAYLAGGIVFAASTGMFGDMFGGTVPTGSTGTTASATATVRR